MTIKELRSQTGMTQIQFAVYFNIPIDSLRNWEQGKKRCAGYLLELIEYKLKKERLI